MGTAMSGRYANDRWIALVLGTLAVAGCAGPPTLVVEHPRGGVVMLSTAPRDETYTLYNLSNRVEATTLAAGDRIGFVRQDGHLQAVAGDDRIPLAEAEYSWAIEGAPAWDPFGHPAPRLPSTSTRSQNAAGFASLVKGLLWLANGAHHHSP
jgi:hypothetical protein